MSPRSEGAAARGDPSGVLEGPHCRAAQPAVNQPGAIHAASVMYGESRDPRRWDNRPS